MKIKFDRIVTYREECEAEVTSDDPVRAVIDGEFDRFLVVSRETMDVNLGDIQSG